MKLPDDLPRRYEQLSLDLDDVMDDAFERGISQEEARLRSETARHVFEDGETPEWFEEYQELREAGFSWRVACYIAWKASPSSESFVRQPKTQLELARDVLGLRSDRVIATWRKNNPAIDEWVGLMQAAPMMKGRAAAIRALCASAGDPDHRHAPDRRILFTMTGDLSESFKIEREVTVDDLSLLSDAELEKLSGRLMKVPHSTHPQPLPKWRGEIGADDEGEGARPCAPTG